MFWKNTLLLSLSLTVFSCGPGQTTVTNNTAKDEKGSPKTKPNIPTKEKDVSIADMGKSVADVGKDVSRKPIDMSKADMDVPNEAITPFAGRNMILKNLPICVLESIRFSWISYPNLLGSMPPMAVNSI